MNDWHGLSTINGVSVAALAGSCDQVAIRPSGALPKRLIPKTRAFLFGILTLGALWIASTVEAGPVYTDAAGREWLDVNDTSNFSRSDVAAVCPTDGATPCTGSLGGTNLTGWVWATTDQVREVVQELTELGTLLSDYEHKGSSSEPWAPALLRAFPATWNGAGPGGTCRAVYGRTSNRGGCGGYCEPYAKFIDCPIDQGPDYVDLGAGDGLADGAYPEVGAFFWRGSGSCSVPVTTLKQYSLPWGPQPYDSIPYTIANKGCGLTALTMAINSEPKAVRTTPASLNLIAKYTASGDVIWSASATAHQTNLRMTERWIDATKDRQRALEFVRNALCTKKRPVILRVPGHFVLATGISGDEITIADPGYNRTRISDYGNVFQTRGYVFDPPDNLHALHVSLSPAGRFRISAPDGSVTGALAADDDIVQDIPESSYFVDSIDDDTTGEAATEQSHIAAIKEPVDGIYSVDIRPVRDAIYDIKVIGYARDGTSVGEFDLKQLGTSGRSRRIEIRMVNTPGALVEITEAVSFGSLTDDLITAYRLGHIRNLGLLKALKAKLEAAERASTRGHIEPAMGSLYALQRLVQAQTGKGVSAEAASILNRSIDQLSRSLYGGSPHSN